MSDIGKFLRSVAKQQAVGRDLERHRQRPDGLGGQPGAATLHLLNEVGGVAGQALYSIMILLDCDVLVHYLIRCIATDTIINLYGFYKPLWQSEQLEELIKEMDPAE